MTYLLEVAALGLLALRLGSRRGLTSGTGLLLLSHLCEEPPVSRLVGQVRDVLILAGLGRRRFRGAFFPLLILSLLCLPTGLRAAACLVLVLAASPRVACVAPAFGLASLIEDSSSR